MANVLGQLVNHDEPDAACVKQVVEWIVTGTLKQAWERDRSEVVRCVLGAIATLFAAIDGYFDDDPGPLIGDVSQPEGTDRSDAEAACIELGAACGAQLPSAASSVAGGLIPWEKILMALLQKLLELLPDLIGSDG